MEYQWLDRYSIGTNRTIGTNGRVECTPTQVETIENIISPHNEMHFTNGIPISGKPYQWNTNGTNGMECYSIGNNGSIGTNGRVECTPTQLKAIEKILSLNNEIHLTNGIPLVACHSIGIRLC